MIEGPRMVEPEEAPIKVQVVYYLTRAGQLQQPHLIDVTISPSSNGLYLRDVKERLTAIRGKGVADSFSWSCKRNYKNNYIWQDLTDDDKILPLGDGEFVLKGSGLYAAYRAAGKGEYLDSNVDPDSTSLSPKQEVISVHNRIDLKKFDLDAPVKRSKDQCPQKDHHHAHDQRGLAAALSLSLQLINNPQNVHLRRLSKDKSMDLNQQVMNSLSQAKAGPAEECTLDRYDMSSNGTFLSEDSQQQQQHNFRESTSVTAAATRNCSKSASSSSRTTDLSFDAVPGIAEQPSQSHSKDRPNCAEDESQPKDGKDAVATATTGRSEKPDDLPPPIKPKLKASVSQELTDDAMFMLSPRRIMAVLSTPEKKLGKMLHSSSLRSTPSQSGSSQNVEQMSAALKLSKQATCLSQLRFCSQLNHHPTDSRPDSPVRPSNTISILVRSAAANTSHSPRTAAGSHKSGAYWTRWTGRKSRSAKSKVLDDPDISSPAAPTQADSRLPAADPSTATPTSTVRLNPSFEFDMPVDANSSGPGTPTVLPTPPTSTSSTSPSQSSISNPPPSPSAENSIKPSSHRTSPCSANSTSLGHKLPAPEKLSVEEMSLNISVKEVITERSSASAKQGYMPAIRQLDFTGCNVEEVTIQVSPNKSNTRRTLSIDSTASLPKVLLHDSIPGAGAPVRAAEAQPESPESPLKANPPCSPIRTLSPVERPVPSPASANRRHSEDGRARPRGLVNEAAPKDCKYMKDLVAKELERSKIPSGSGRRSTGSLKSSGMKTRPPNSTSSTVDRSPPRISSLLWEDPSQITPKKMHSNHPINRDERPLCPGRSNLDWEKTLQGAGSLSFPPPGFGRILQECGQCGRTFKPDSLKVHMRGCHAGRRSQDTERRLHQNQAQHCAPKSNPSITTSAVVSQSN